MEHQDEGSEHRMLALHWLPAFLWFSVDAESPSFSRLQDSWGYKKALTDVLSPWTMGEHAALQGRKPIHSAAVDVSYGSASL